MPRYYSLLIALLLIGLSSARPLLADDAAADAMNNKLRDALKNTMLQMRDLQNQLVTLQADKDQMKADNDALQAKLDTANATIKSLTDTAAKNQSDWDAAKADLNNQVTQRDHQIADLNASLTQWKAAFTQVDALQKTTEGARQELAGQVIVLQRLVADRETKNLALFQTGNEILIRYEKFSLGEALAAKEPFLGITRTKLQTLVQGYQDKLTDNLSPAAPKTAMITPKVQ
jgi:peptidoglycan hydrolase CwlO-like protein